MEIRDLRRELLQIIHHFYERGWILATSGNFSVRIDPNRILITASGKDKGNLQDSDLILIDAKGKVLDSSGQIPSAESELHCHLYQTYSEIGAIFHTHSMYATALSSMPDLKVPITISNYEMLKALSGVDTHHHTELLPVFPNDQDMNTLATSVLEFMKLNRGIHGFLITAHGLYSWGSNLAEAKRHTEALEFLIEAEYRRLKWK